MAKIQETETDLISLAQSALSNCSWTVGECAAKWTKKYAKGRTDGDFGMLIGLTGDQVFQRRRVWESFADVHENYSKLKWSHFYSAVNWDDAAECLQWAEEIDATVAEMKAWRRAQHGEDLSTPGAEDLDAPFDAGVEYLTASEGFVREPELVGAGAGRSRNGAMVDDLDRPATATAVARESEPYAPFGKGARGPAASERESGDSAAATSEQVVKRIASALEKCNAAMTPSILEDFADLPFALQQRLINSVDNLVAKVAGIR